MFQPLRIDRREDGFVVVVGFPWPPDAISGLILGQVHADRASLANISIQTLISHPWLDVFALIPLISSRSFFSHFAARPNGSGFTNVASGSRRTCSSPPQSLCQTAPFVPGCGPALQKKEKEKKQKKKTPAGSVEAPHLPLERPPSKRADPTIPPGASRCIRSPFFPPLNPKPGVASHRFHTNSAGCSFFSYPPPIPTLPLSAELLHGITSA